MADTAKLKKDNQAHNKLEQIKKRLVEKAKQEADQR